MEIPKGMEGRYTLNDSLADEVIKYISKEKSATPHRPFFVYYAPGATHAPHHVPKEWIAKFKGKFDQGWDKYREEAYYISGSSSLASSRPTPSSHRDQRKFRPGILSVAIKSESPRA